MTKNLEKPGTVAACLRGLRTSPPGSEGHPRSFHRLEQDLLNTKLYTYA